LKKDQNRETINFYQGFKNCYNRIIHEFNYEEKKDWKARDVLLRILKEKDREWKSEVILREFKGKLKEKQKILIFGCGPSLEISIQTIIKESGKEFFKNFINLTADGASVLLREKNLPIDGLFSDLDGITKQEFEYARFVIVHSHGDNIEKLFKYKSAIIEKRNVIATTQVKPKKGIFNPGGFTDGDRILYFIKNLILPHQQLYLIGMDFKGIVGKFSKPYMRQDTAATPTKKKKLEFAVKLIEELPNEVRNKLYFVNSEKVSKKFKYLSLSRFLKEEKPHYLN
jgi:hypothetical protein